MSPNALLSEIAALFENRGSEAYFGEEVTQLQHAVQTADCAIAAQADGELVVAALLHDVGHLLGGGDIHAEIGVIDHGHSCVEWLRTRGFSDRVIGLISGHVDAKRYLVSANRGYYARLSEASKRTLLLQGGAMDAIEASGFEAGPYFKDLLRLRSWDEQAKNPNVEPKGLDGYLAYVSRAVEQARG